LCSAIESAPSTAQVESSASSLLASAVTAPDITRLSLGRVGISRLVSPAEPIFRRPVAAASYSHPHAALWSHAQIFLRKGDADIDPALLRVLAAEKEARTAGACVHTIAQV
jgi:hypothetical protein